LGPRASFATFLLDCISPQDYQKLRPQLQSLFRHFESPCPYEQQQQQENQLPIRKCRVKKSASSLKRRNNALRATTNSRTASGENENKKYSTGGKTFFPKENISLTAPVRRKGNSLLCGTDKSRFVGSHFNSSLSNVQSLFRQTTVKNKSLKTTLHQDITPTNKKRKIQRENTTAPRKPTNTLSAKSSALVPPTPTPRRHSPLYPTTQSSSPPKIRSLVAEAFQSIHDGRRKRRK